MDDRGYWPDELWNIIEEPSNRLILVIGASDIGKAVMDRKERTLRNISPLF